MLGLLLLVTAVSGAVVPSVNGTVPNSPPYSNGTVPEPELKPTAIFTSIAYGGSGYVFRLGRADNRCPQGTIGSFLSTDRTKAKIVADRFVAGIGPGTSFSEARKNCQLNIGIQYPNGWQYIFNGQSMKGYVLLDPGVVADAQTTYYFSGSVAQASAATRFAGPADKDFRIMDSIPPASQVVSPCGQEGALNINTQIFVHNDQNPQASGIIALDIETELNTADFTWRRC